MLICSVGNKVEKSWLELTWVDPQFLASPTTRVELSWTFYQALELSRPKFYISDLDLTWPKLNIPIQVNVGLTQSSKRSTFFKSTQGKVEKNLKFFKKENFMTWFQTYQNTWFCQFFCSHKMIWNLLHKSTIKYGRSIKFKFF